MHTRFWYVDLKEGENLEDLVIDGRIILKWVLKKQVGKSHNKLCCCCEYTKKCKAREKVRKGLNS
jgi:hypothetical protein